MEEKLVKIARRVGVNPKKLKEVGSIEEISKMSPSELAKRAKIQVDKASVIVRLVKEEIEVEMGMEQDTRTKAPSDVDAEVSPYIALYGALKASRGSVLSMIVGESYTGKTTAALFAVDKLIKPRKGSTLSTQGIAYAVERCDEGFCVDDLQRCENVDAILNLARSIVEFDGILGANRRYERGLEDSVTRILNESLTVTVTWDASMKKPNSMVPESDARRILLLRPRDGHCPLLYKVKRFMVRGYTVRTKTSAADALEDPEDYSDILIPEYREYWNVSEVPKEANAVMTIISNELGEDAVRALYYNYPSVLEASKAVYRWWKEVCREYWATLMGGVPVNCQGAQRVEISSGILFAFGVSSLLGYRYNYEINSEKEVKEVINLVEEQHRSVAVGNARWYRKVFMRALEKVDAPF